MRESITKENLKAQSFFLGLTVLWLVGPKNDLWILLSPILLCFIFSFGCFGRKTQRLMLGSFLSCEQNPMAEGFLLGLAVVCLRWPENYFLWVLFKTILLHFRFPFAWFGRETQRLLLGCFLFWEENLKAEAFWLGLVVLCLGWPENDFWVLFKTILLRFGFSHAWFFLRWFLGSFPNYSSAFSFSVCLVWPKNPKALAWLFSLSRGKPKGRSFLAWFDNSLLGLAEKWFMGSFLFYPSTFSFFIWLFWPKNLKVVAWFARCFLSRDFLVWQLFDGQKIVFFCVPRAYLIVVDYYSSSATQKLQFFCVFCLSFVLW